ncbi:MAG: energy transducer TonB [Bacteroidales bacterium]|nr:energy transducer TonB [Bacteroidales bacterium]MDD4822505.1 energy transducer TonB [Bacteroidales bacterium]
MDTTEKHFSCALLKTILILPMAACLISSFNCRAGSSLNEASLSGSYSATIISNTTGVSQKDTTKKEAIPFALLSNPPKFPGGDKILTMWVGNHLVYPEGAMKRGEKGRVTVSFIIDEKGKVTEGRIERGVSPDLDAEALRVIGIMPDWEPGTKDEKPVAVRYILPITFKLPDPIVNGNGTQQGKESHPVANPGSTGDNTLDQLANIVLKAKAKEKTNTDSSDITSKIPLELFDTRPLYPGGESALSEFVRKTIQYPLEAMKKGISGRVTVSFFIESDGKLTSAAIEKGVSPEIDAEALRIVSCMPDWKPATSGGKAIRMKQILYLNFTIPNAAVNKQYGVNFRNTDPEISKPATFGKGEKALTNYLTKEMKKIPVIERCAFKGKVDFLIYLDTKGNVMGASISTKEADQRALAPGVTSAMEDVIVKLPAFNPALIGKNAVNVEYAFSMLFPFTK